MSLNPVLPLTSSISSVLTLVESLPSGDHFASVIQAMFSQPFNTGGEWYHQIVPPNISSLFPLVLCETMDGFTIIPNYF